MDRSHVFRSGLALLCFLASGVTDGGAQSLKWTEVGDKVACAGCRINFEVEATIDLQSRGILVQQSSGIVIDRLGRLWVPSAAPTGGVIVIDAHGRVVRTVGDTTRPVHEINYVFGLGSHGVDSVFYLDGRRVIASIVDVESFRERKVPLAVRPASEATLPLQDGRLLANVSLGTREAIGRPFALLDPAGQVEHLFGASDEVIRPDLSMEARLRQLTKAGESGFWSANINALRFELWSTDGKLLRRLARNPTWFIPWHVWHGFSPSKELQPRVRAIRDEGDGLLWIIINVPNSSWREALVPVTNAGIAGYVPEAYNGVYDTVIEVIDTEQGRVVARERTEAFVSGFTTDGRLVVFDGPTEGGRLIIWRAMIDYR